MLAFLRKVVGLNDPKINQLTPLMENIIDDEDVLQISTALSTVTDDENVVTQTRKDTLTRTLAYIKSAAWKNKINDTTKEFIPVVENYQIVRVNFSGLGSELKDPHYAIVWDVERKRDGIVVIPLTSFKEHSTYENGKEFNIGKIGHFTTSSVVLMQQVVQVSRKRILRYRFSNGSREVIVRLNEVQKQRVRDGFRVLGLGQKTLLEEIRDRAQDYLPIFADPELQYSHLFRPFEVVETSVSQLKYKVSGDSQIYEVNRKLFDKQHYDRFDIIERWVHPVPVKNTTTGVILQSRDEARQHAYQEILNAIESLEVRKRSDEKESSA